MMKSFLTGATALLLLTAGAADLFAQNTPDREATILRLPPAKRKPVIDGVMSEGEWINASHQFGAISEFTGGITLRWVDFWFGYDDENIYFAQRSVLPPKTMKLSDRNEAEIQLRFPGSPVRTVSFNPKGAGKLPEGTKVANKQTGKFWISEASIPLKSLGVKAIPYGQECGLQMTRKFVDQDEIASWHKPTERHPDGTWVPEKDIPGVGFRTLWTHLARPGISHRPTWVIDNRTARPQKLLCRSEVTGKDVPPHRERTTLEAAPHRNEAWVTSGIWETTVPRTLWAEIVDAETGKVYFRRSFLFNVGGSRKWVEPDPPFRLEIGNFPSYKRLRFLLTCPSRTKLKNIQDQQFTLRGEDGKEITRFTPKLRADGWFYDGPLPDLPEGVYHIVAEFKNPKGETEKLSDHFAVKHFEWEGLNLGKDRIVIPPFKPLQAKDGEIKALQTGFKEAGNGFWDAIYALDENILAKPVEFVIDGKPFETVAEREIETSPDLVIRETDLRYKTLKLTVRREYEQDGFCKITLKFDPEKPFRITTLDLNIPLKKSVAQYFTVFDNRARFNTNRKIPENPGTVMKSSSGGKSFQFPYLKGFYPYFWLGEYQKGLSFCCENPHCWGRKPGTASQEITVDEDAVRLRLHLAAIPRVYKKGESIVTAFQPTPVKPRPARSAQYLRPRPFGIHDVVPDEELPTLAPPPDARYYFLAPRWYLFARYRDGVCSVPNDDWSFVRMAREAKWKSNEEVKNFLREYYKRNNLDPNAFSKNNPTSWMANCPMEKYMLALAQDIRYNAMLFPYGNPRELMTDWPEFEVYGDEWRKSPWRKRVNSSYAAEPSPSYIDFMIYNIRARLREGLIDGYYYDMITAYQVDNPVISEAQEMSNGLIRPVWGIFSLRELVKRTAVMMYQEKKDFCGYAPLWLHMTGAPFVPVLSFAGIQVDWEMNFSTMVYQKRFPIEYAICNSTGAQAGVYPTGILNFRGVPEEDFDRIARSAIATCFVYHVDPGFKQAAPQWFRPMLDKIYEFGYGKEDTVVIPAFAPENPVTVTPDRVKATVAKRADGALLLRIGNLGEAAEAEFDLHGLAKGEATDLMTGKKLGSGGRFKLPIKDYDFALVEVRP